MREALQVLSNRGQRTPCADKPVLYTEVRQSPAEAAELCKDCPVIKLCEPLGFTESVYADDMVYGGYTWRRGIPLVSETAYQARRGLGEIQKVRPKKPLDPKPILL